METCARCGSSRSETVPGPHPGGHFAKLACADCGRWLKWLPAPASPGGGPSAEVLAMVHFRRRPAPLEGSAAQCRFARSLRATALHNFARMGRRDLVDLVRCIVDATWFLANKGRSLAAIRWPSPGQMEPAVATSQCPNCGDPVYLASMCSDECGDEFAASLMEDSAAVSRSVRASSGESIDDLF